MQRTRTQALYTAAAVATAALLLATACGSSKSSTAGLPGGPMLQTIGQGEGALNIIAWAGYAESGANDPKVNWVTPFTQQTGCKVNVKIGNTSDEMVQLMGSGQYDGVSASGNASLRLIHAGQVAPVDVNLLTNFNDVAPFLKMQQYNSLNGTAYGMPHGWGANLLMWNTKVVTTPLDSWSVVWDPASPYKGKVTAY